MRTLILLKSVVLFSLLLVVACGNRQEELRNGVTYAKNALDQAGSNPFSKATYQNIIGNGGTGLDYIKAILPKTDPPFDSWEAEKPTHPWTIVIRAGTEPGEWWIEGYGNDLKKPLEVARAQVKLSETE